MSVTASLTMLVGTWLPIVLGLLGCEAPIPRQAPEPPTAVVVLLDASPSVNNTNRCDELSARLQDLLTDRSAKRTHVLALATGSSASNGSVRTLVPWTSLQVKREMFSTIEQADEARQKRVDELVTQCRNAWLDADISPIYSGLSEARESLTAFCEQHSCGSQAKYRRVFAHSDLHEGVHVALHHHLKFAGQPHPPKVREFLATKPIPTLDFSGVSLSVCLGAHRRDLIQASRPAVLHVWRQVLGDGQSFDSSCPTINRAVQP